MSEPGGHVSESAPVAVEGRLHPLAVLVIARRFVGVSLIPAIAVFLSAGTRVIVPAIVVALFVGLPLAILAWWRFRYRVAGGRLELHAGVLSRSVRTIPLERVRGMDVTAPFLHRLLGLVKVDVEAAAGGGRSAELSLAAVSLAQADELREAILGAARAAGDELPAEPTTLYRATPGLLALGGITSMTYLLAPAAIVGFFVNIAGDLPGNVVERGLESGADRLPTDIVGLALVSLAGLAVVLAAAAAGSLLVDWDFTVRDEGERLAASRGLLTRRLVHLDRERIRGADVRDTPLRRPLGLAAVTAIAAGVGGRGGTALAPVVRREAVPALLRAVDRAAPDPSAPLEPHPLAARPRRLVRALALPLVALGVLLGFGIYGAAALALVVSVLAVPLALDRYRQLGHAFDGRRLTLRGGSLRRRWSEVDPDAAVSFELRSSPGQRRVGLTTLRVHLGQGAGSRRALDIGDEQATALLRDVRPELFAPVVTRPD